MDNYYEFASQWTDTFRSMRGDDAKTFLSCFVDTLQWWYSVDRTRGRTDDDDGEWTLADDLLCFLDEVAQSVGEKIPQGELFGPQWIWFLEGLTNDCKREADNDNDESGVCTFGEFLESFGRGLRTLIQCPDIQNYKITQHTPLGLGLPSNRDYTLGIFLTWIPQACTFIAALTEDNVGVPGDPQEYWKYIFELHSAGQPIGNGGWSTPPWMK